MRRTILLLTVFIGTLLFTGGATAQDLSQYEKKSQTSADGYTLNYRVLYPENMKKGKKYPLVLVLHGAGERGDNNEAQLVHGGKLFLDPANRKKYPAIVLFPQCPKESTWYRHREIMGDKANSPVQPTREIEAVKELVDQFIASGDVNVKRIYVTGLSMGGFGTFGIVSIYPDLFAAAAPICGGGIAANVPKYAGKLPFWVFHGADDSVVLPSFSRQMVEALEANGAKVKYTEYPGVNHNSWDSVFADPNYLKWMFKQKKRK